MNPVLERLLAEREQQVSLVDGLLGGAERETRDLVPAEADNLKAIKERISAIDAQTGPLAEFEDLRITSSETLSRVMSAGRREGGVHSEPRALGDGGDAAYRTAGDFLADYSRSRGIGGIPVDAGAGARLQRVLAKQTTVETPGLLPTPIVGEVLNLIDANRPFITSIGARSMPPASGTKFQRPRITQHVLVGEQTVEKTELPSRQMKIETLDFAKKTYGGAVNISRQDIDWTSPSAWNILLGDLADVYAQTTEAAAASAFATGITQTVAAETGDLTGWAKALYQAAAMGYRGAKLLPDRLWVSLDMWATLGAIVDQARLIFPPGSQGGSELTRFSGMVFALPRIVVPDLPDGTAIIGSSKLFEFYEERIGLLSAVEPSILGVEVAYGGYAAFGFMEPKAFVKVSAPAGGA